MAPMLETQFYISTNYPTKRLKINVRFLSSTHSIYTLYYRYYDYYGYLNYDWLPQCCWDMMVCYFFRCFCANCECSSIVLKPLQQGNSMKHTITIQINIIFFIAKWQTTLLYFVQSRTHAIQQITYKVWF